MKYYYTIIFLIITLTTLAQTPETILQQVQQNYTNEKIYIHYDKANYVAGETIWFKGYIMQGIYPTTKSTILKVALINNLGFVVQQKILPINGGSAVGEFLLEKMLPEGSYTIKANTAFMLNFGFEKFYYKEITIYNPIKKNSVEKIENAAFEGNESGGSFE